MLLALLLAVLMAIAGLGVAASAAENRTGYFWLRPAGASNYVYTYYDGETYQTSVPQPLGKYSSPINSSDGSAVVVNLADQNIFQTYSSSYFRNVYAVKINADVGSGDPVQVRLSANKDKNWKTPDYGRDETNIYYSSNTALKYSEFESVILKQINVSFDSSKNRTNGSVKITITAYTEPDDFSDSTLIKTYHYYAGAYVSAFSCNMQFYDYARGAIVTNAAELNQQEYNGQKTYQDPQVSFGNNLTSSPLNFAVNSSEAKVTLSSSAANKVNATIKDVAYDSDNETLAYQYQAYFLAKSDAEKDTVTYGVADSAILANLRSSVEKAKSSEDLTKLNIISINGGNWKDLGTTKTFTLEQGVPGYYFVRTKAVATLKSDTNTTWSAESAEGLFKVDGTNITMAYDLPTTGLYDDAMSTGSKSVLADVRPDETGTGTATFQLRITSGGADLKPGTSVPEFGNTAWIGYQLIRSGESFSSSTPRYWLQNDGTTYSTSTSGVKNINLYNAERKGLFTVTVEGLDPGVTYYAKAIVATDGKESAYQPSSDTVTLRYDPPTITSFDIGSTEKVFKSKGTDGSGTADTMTIKASISATDTNAVGKQYTFGGVLVPDIEPTESESTEGEGSESEVSEGETVYKGSSLIASLYFTDELSTTTWTKRTKVVSRKLVQVPYYYSGTNRVRYYRSEYVTTESWTETPMTADNSVWYKVKDGDTLDGTKETSINSLTTQSAVGIWDIDGSNGKKAWEIPIPAKLSDITELDGQEDRVVDSRKCAYKLVVTDPYTGMSTVAYSGTFQVDSELPVFDNPDDALQIKVGTKPFQSARTPENMLTAGATGNGVQIKIGPASDSNGIRGYDYEMYYLSTDDSNKAGAPNYGSTAQAVLDTIQKKVNQTDGNALNAQDNIITKTTASAARDGEYGTFTVAKGGYYYIKAWAVDNADRRTAEPAEGFLMVDLSQPNPPTAYLYSEEKVGGDFKVDNGAIADYTTAKVWLKPVTGVTNGVDVQINAKTAGEGETIVYNYESYFLPEANATEKDYGRTPESVLEGLKQKVDLGQTLDNVTTTAETPLTAENVTRGDKTENVEHFTVTADGYYYVKVKVKTTKTDAADVTDTYVGLFKVDGTDDTPTVEAYTLSQFTRYDTGANAVYSDKVVWLFAYSVPKTGKTLTSFEFSTDNGLTWTSFGEEGYKVSNHNYYTVDDDEDQTPLHLLFDNQFLGRAQAVDNPDDEQNGWLLPLSTALKTPDGQKEYQMSINLTALGIDDYQSIIVKAKDDLGSSSDPGDAVVMRTTAQSLTSGATMSHDPVEVALAIGATSMDVSTLIPDLKNNVAQKMNIRFFGEDSQEVALLKRNWDSSTNTWIASDTFHQCTFSKDPVNYSGECDDGVHCPYAQNDQYYKPEYVNVQGMKQESGSQSLSGWREYDHTNRYSASSASTAGRLGKISSEHTSVNTNASPDNEASKTYSNNTYYHCRLRYYHIFKMNSSGTVVNYNSDSFSSIEFVGTSKAGVTDWMFMPYDSALPKLIFYTIDTSKAYFHTYFNGGFWFNTTMRAKAGTSESTESNWVISGYRVSVAYNKGSQTNSAGNQIGWKLVDMSGGGGSYCEIQIQKFTDYSLGTMADSGGTDYGTRIAGSSDEDPNAHARAVREGTASETDITKCHDHPYLSGTGNNIQNLLIKISGSNVKVYQIEGNQGSKVLTETDFLSASSGGKLVCSTSNCPRPQIDGWTISDSYQTKSDKSGVTGTTNPYGSDKYAYGFGPFVGYNSHNCPAETRVTFSRISLATQAGRSLSEVVTEPSWGDGKAKFITNISDEGISDFNDPILTSQISWRINNDDTRYVGWGAEGNRPATNAFIKRISGSSSTGNINTLRVGIYEGPDDGDGTTSIDSSLNEFESAKVQTDQVADYMSKMYFDAMGFNVMDSTPIVEQMAPSGGMVKGQVYSVEDVDNINFNVQPAKYMTSSANPDFPAGRWYMVHDTTGFDGVEEDPRSRKYSDALDTGVSLPGRYTYYFAPKKSDVDAGTLDPDDPSCIFDFIVNTRPVANFETAIDEYITVNDKQYPIFSGKTSANADKIYYTGDNGSDVEITPSNGVITGLTSRLIIADRSYDPDVSSPSGPYSTDSKKMASTCTVKDADKIKKLDPDQGKYVVDVEKAYTYLAEDQADYALTGIEEVEWRWEVLYPYGSGDSKTMFSVRSTGWGSDTDHDPNGKSLLELASGYSTVADADTNYFKSSSEALKIHNGKNLYGAYGIEAADFLTFAGLNKSAVITIYQRVKDTSMRRKAVFKNGAVSAYTYVDRTNTGEVIQKMTSLVKQKNVGAKSIKTVNPPSATFTMSKPFLYNTAVSPNDYITISRKSSQSQGEPFTMSWYIGLGAKKKEVYYTDTYKLSLNAAGSNTSEAYWDYKYNGEVVLECVTKPTVLQENSADKNVGPSGSPYGLATTGGEWKVSLTTLKKLLGTGYAALDNGGLDNSAGLILMLEERCYGVKPANALVANAQPEKITDTSSRTMFYKGDAIAPSSPIITAETHNSGDGQKDGKDIMSSYEASKYLDVTSKTDPAYVQIRVGGSGDLEGKLAGYGFYFYKKKGANESAYYKFNQPDGGTTGGSLEAIPLEDGATDEQILTAKASATVTVSVDLKDGGDDTTGNPNDDLANFNVKNVSGGDLVTSGDVTPLKERYFTFKIDANTLGDEDLDSLNVAIFAFDNASGKSTPSGANETAYTRIEGIKLTQTIPMPPAMEVKNGTGGLVAKISNVTGYKTEELRKAAWKAEDPSRTDAQWSALETVWSKKPEGTSAEKIEKGFGYDVQTGDASLGNFSNSAAILTFMPKMGKFVLDNATGVYERDDSGSSYYEGTGGNADLTNAAQIRYYVEYREDANSPIVPYQDNAEGAKSISKWVNMKEIDSDVYRTKEQVLGIDLAGNEIESWTGEPPLVLPSRTLSFNKDGYYTVYAQVVNGSGTESAWRKVSFLVDTETPSAPQASFTDQAGIGYVADGKHWAQSLEATVYGSTDKNLDYYEYSDDNGANWHYLGPANTNQTLRIPDTTRDADGTEHTIPSSGTIQMLFRAVDKAKLTGQSKVYTLLVDSAAPTMDEPTVEASTTSTELYKEYVFSISPVIVEGNSTQADLGNNGNTVTTTLTSWDAAKAQQIELSLDQQPRANDTQILVPAKGTATIVIKPAANLNLYKVMAGETTATSVPVPYESLGDGSYKVFFDNVQTDQVISISYSKNPVVSFSGVVSDGDTRVANDTSIHGNAITVAQVKNEKNEDVTGSMGYKSGDTSVMVPTGGSVTLNIQLGDRMSLDSVTRGQNTLETTKVDDKNYTLTISDVSVSQAVEVLFRGESTQLQTTFAASSAKTAARLMKLASGLKAANTPGTLNLLGASGDAVTTMESPTFVDENGKSTSDASAYALYYGEWSEGIDPDNISALQVGKPVKVTLRVTLASGKALLGVTAKTKAESDQDYSESHPELVMLTPGSSDYEHYNASGARVYQFTYTPNEKNAFVIKVGADPNAVMDSTQFLNTEQQDITQEVDDFSLFYGTSTVANDAGQLAYGSPVTVTLKLDNTYVLTAAKVETTDLGVTGEQTLSITQITDTASDAYTKYYEVGYKIYQFTMTPKTINRLVFTLDREQTREVQLTVNDSHAARVWLQKNNPIQGQNVQLRWMPVDGYALKQVVVQEKDANGAKQIKEALFNKAGGDLAGKQAPEGGEQYLWLDIYVYPDTAKTGNPLEVVAYFDVTGKPAENNSKLISVTATHGTVSPWDNLTTFGADGGYTVTTGSVYLPSSGREFTFTPDKGYALRSAILSGKSPEWDEDEGKYKDVDQLYALHPTEHMDNGVRYYTVKVPGNVILIPHELEVIYERKTYSVTALSISEGGSGTVNINTKEAAQKEGLSENETIPNYAVPEGCPVTLEIAPYSGVIVRKVELIHEDGTVTDLGAVDRYYLASVNENVSFRVTFYGRVPASTNIDQAVTVRTENAADKGSGWDASYRFQYAILQGAKETIDVTQYASWAWTEWTDQTSYTFHNLLPNTQYTAFARARDAVGNEATDPMGTEFYTKANDPRLLRVLDYEENGNTTTKSVQVMIDANGNPDGTEYLVYYATDSTLSDLRSAKKFEDGVESEEEAWAVLSDGKITVDGLPPGKTVWIQVQARNVTGDLTNYSANVIQHLLSPAAPPANTLYFTEQETPVADIELYWDEPSKDVEYLDFFRDGSEVLDSSLSASRQPPVADGEPYKNFADTISEYSYSFKIGGKTGSAQLAVSKEYYDAVKNTTDTTKKVAMEGLLATVTRENQSVTDSGVKDLTPYQQTMTYPRFPVIITSLSNMVPNIVQNDTTMDLSIKVTMPTNQTMRAQRYLLMLQAYDKDTKTEIPGWNKEAHSVWTSWETVNGVKVPVATWTSHFTRASSEDTNWTTTETNPLNKEYVYQVFVKEIQSTGPGGPDGQTSGEDEAGKLVGEGVEGRLGKVYYVNKTDYGFWYTKDLAAAVLLPGDGNTYDSTKDGDASDWSEANRQKGTWETYELDLYTLGRDWDKPIHDEALYIEFNETPTIDLRDRSASSALNNTHNTQNGLYKTIDGVEDSDYVFIENVKGAEMKFRVDVEVADVDGSPDGKKVSVSATLSDPEHSSNLTGNPVPALAADYRMPTEVTGGGLGSRNNPISLEFDGDGPSTGVYNSLLLRASDGITESLVRKKLTLVINNSMPSMDITSRVPRMLQVDEALTDEQFLSVESRLVKLDPSKVNSELAKTEVVNQASTLKSILGAAGYEDVRQIVVNGVDSLLESEKNGNFQAAVVDQLKSMGITGTSNAYLDESGNPTKKGVIAVVLRRNVEANINVARAALYVMKDTFKEKFGENGYRDILELLTTDDSETLATKLASNSNYITAVTTLLVNNYKTSSYAGVTTATDTDNIYLDGSGNPTRAGIIAAILSVDADTRRYIEIESSQLNTAIEGLSTAEQRDEKIRVKWTGQQDAVSYSYYKNLAEEPNDPKFWVELDHAINKDLCNWLTKSDDKYTPKFVGTSYSAAADTHYVMVETRFGSNAVSNNVQFTVKPAPTAVMASEPHLDWTETHDAEYNEFAKDDDEKTKTTIGGQATEYATHHAYPVITDDQKNSADDAFKIEDGKKMVWKVWDDKIQVGNGSISGTITADLGIYESFTELGFIYQESIGDHLAADRNAAIGEAGSHTIYAGGKKTAITENGEYAVVAYGLKPYTTYFLWTFFTPEGSEERVYSENCITVTTGGAFTEAIYGFSSKVKRVKETDAEKVSYVRNFLEVTETATNGAQGSIKITAHFYRADEFGNFVDSSGKATTDPTQRVHLTEEQMAFAKQVFQFDSTQELTGELDESSNVLKLSFGEVKLSGSQTSQLTSNNVFWKLAKKPGTTPGEVLPADQTQGHMIVELTMESGDSSSSNTYVRVPAENNTQDIFVLDMNSKVTVYKVGVKPASDALETSEGWQGTKDSEQQDVYVGGSYEFPGLELGYGGSTGLDLVFSNIGDGDLNNITAAVYSDEECTTLSSVFKVTKGPTATNLLASRKDQDSGTIQVKLDPGLGSNIYTGYLMITSREIDEYNENHRVVIRLRQVVGQATLSGRIYYSALMPGQSDNTGTFEVTIYKHGEEAGRTVTTSEQGFFEIPFIENGSRYDVVVRRDGFLAFDSRQSTLDSSYFVDLLNADMEDHDSFSWVLALRGGDFDGDGDIDNEDMKMLTMRYNHYVASEQNENEKKLLTMMDFNNDGIINALDRVYLLMNRGYKTADYDYSTRVKDQI